jgi:hypothetical protein
VQPAAIIVVMQSQHAWIMSQQALSPLMQVTQTPSLVISHLHMPIVRLQQHTIAPFIMQQQPHLEPPIMLQRFCNMPQAILSSHVHVIFMPPVHFSIFILHCGIIMPVITGEVIGIVPAIPGIIPLVMGFIVAVIMCDSPKPLFPLRAALAWNP